MKTILTNDNDFEVTFDDSQEAKDRIFNGALEFFKSQQNFSGEALAQTDSTYSDGVEFLCWLADEGFKFKSKWID